MGITRPTGAQAPPRARAHYDLSDLVMAAVAAVGLLIAGVAMIANGAGDPPGIRTATPFETPPAAALHGER